MTFTFEGTCANLANACDAFSYINIHVTFQKKKEDGSIEETHKTVSVKPITQNVIALYPESTVSKGKPINILFLIDTSNSMGYVQGPVISGLKNLLNSLKDNETYIEIGPIFSPAYSSVPTGLFEEDGSGNKTVINSWLDANKLPDGAVFYSSYKRAPSTGSSDNFMSKKFSPNMTGADRTKTYDDLASHIDKIFKSGTTYNGNPYDVPLCLLMTQLRRIRTGESSLNTNPQTPTLIYIATNEDDETKLYKVGQKDPAITSSRLGLFGSPYCGISFTEKHQVRKYTTQSFVAYKATSVTAKMKVEVFFDSDGLETSRIMDISFVPGIPYRPITDTDPCPADMDTTYKAAILSSLSLAFQSKTIKRLNTLKCGLVNDTDSTMQTESPYDEVNDKCKSGYFAKESYFKGYDTSGCRTQLTSKGGFENVNFIGQGGEMTTESFEGTDINDAVSKELGATFPKGNYYMSLAILPSSGSCPIPVGSSAGVRFEQLATKLGPKASVVPVCQGQFSNDFVEDAIKYLEVKIGNDVTLDAKVLKKITSVEIIQDGKKITLEKTKDYSVTSSSVTFTDGILTPTTQVFIYYDL